MLNCGAGAGSDRWRAGGHRAAGDGIADRGRGVADLRPGAPPPFSGPGRPGPPPLSPVRHGAVGADDRAAVLGFLRAVWAAGAGRFVARPQAAGPGGHRGGGARRAGVAFAEE